MARNNPKVSAELVDLAGRMRRLIYGGDGVPEWGTKFSQIEAEALEVGRELSRLMMQQSVGEQAERLPDQALHEGEESAELIGTESTVVETTAGDALRAGHGADRNRACGGARS